MKKLALLITSFLVFTAFGQIGFKTRLIQIQEDIAFNANPQTISKQMKKEGYTAEKKEKSDSGSEFSFKGGDYSPDFYFYYHTDKQLITSVGYDSPQQYYQCVAELRENGFTVLSSKKEINDNNVEITIENWGKSGYIYQYTTDPRRSSIQLVTTISQLHDE